MQGSNCAHFPDTLNLAAQFFSLVSILGVQGPYLVPTSLKFGSPFLGLQVTNSFSHSEGGCVEQIRNTQWRKVKVKPMRNNGVTALSGARCVEPPRPNFQCRCY